MTRYILIILTITLFSCSEKIRFELMDSGHKRQHECDEFSISVQWGRVPDLADVAQVSPIKKTIVRDFNNDSYPDVILAGNDHTYDIGPL
jgi:hypothetical protein